MSAIQDAFFKIQDTREKQRALRAVYREALVKSREYQDISDQIRALREKKKKIEEEIRSEYTRECDMLDELVTTMKEEQGRVVDMVLSSLSRGEIIKVRDSRNAVYDPVVNVRFKKSDEQEVSFL